MPLNSGTRLGPYEIVAPLGAGGMGEVYRARDTRLGRDVAVKVLPQHLSSSPALRARFEREAKAISSLNHPHICTLHDIGQEGDTDYLVMELVEGETLTDRLEKGALPPEQVLKLGIEIADALDKAHRAGIVHRDLKPGNVMLTKSGVKLMDFGLARGAGTARLGDRSGVTASAHSESPTVSRPLTAEGAIVGTVQYMAPEQLEGMDVGACTDLWALGCVLYEMATGRRVFEGKSQASLIAAIMTAEVRPMTELAPLAPAALDRLVRALLAKAPDDRPQSAHDAKLVLEWIAAGEMNTPGRGVSGRPATLRTRTWIALAAVLAVVATVGFALGLRRGGHSRVEPRPILHTTIPLQKNTILSGWASPTVALSSDGRSLAYVATSPDGTRRLYVRRLESEETAPVPNSEEAEGPMFSPDGQWVAFAVGVSSGIRRGEMLKYSLATGLTQSICELSDYFGGQWRDDGTILFVNQLSHGLWTVSSAGGRPEPIASSFLVDGKETGLAMRWPQVLPGGQRVISPTGGRLVVIDLRTRELKDTGIRTSFARYSPTGHLLYTTTDDVLMAVPFDPVQGKPIGPAVAVMRDVSQSCNGASVFAFSGNGAFVYATGPLRGSGQEISNVVHIDRRGEIHPLPIEPEFFGRRISLSPDGHRLVVPIQEDLWVYDLVRGTRIKLPKGDMDDCMYPAWAPDGRSLAFSGLRTGATNFDLYQQVADGIALPERLGGTPIEDQVNSFTPDGRAVVFRTFDSQGKSALWLCPLDPRGEPTQLTSGLQKEISARVSPDGRMIAYEGVESDRQELFLTTFPQIGARVPVSQDGGNTPRWSSDGRRIVFANRGRLYSVSVDPGPDIHVGPPEPLFDIPGIALWDPLPDDSGIIALRTDPEAGRQTQVQLVVNWFDELRRLSPVAR